MEFVEILLWSSASFLAFCLFLILIYNYFNGPQTPLAHAMNGKVVVITGGDSSIGWETAKELLSKGAKVIFACRNQEKTISKIQSIESHALKEKCIYIHLDLTSIDSIKQFVKEFKEKVGHLDILVNNAGTCFQEFKLISGIETTFFTNHVGHVILSSLLLKCFNPEGRIINVTSTKYKRINTKVLDEFTATNNLDFGKTGANYDWMKVYVMTKLADLLHSIHLKDYIIKKGLKIKACAVHPGFVRNPFFREIHSCYWTIRTIIMYPFRLILFKDTKMGAQTHLHACYLDYSALTNGGYYKDCHEEKLKPIACLESANKMLGFTKALIKKNLSIKEDPDLKEYFED